MAEPSGGPADHVAGKILFALGRHLGSRQLGWISMSQQGFLVAMNPDRVLSPDVSFTSLERLPSIPKRGFIPCAPDFAVEVRSPDDAWIGVVEKCGIWIGHRSRVVWAVDPTSRRFLVLRPGAAPLEVGPGGQVDAAPVLPEFVFPVDEAFADL